MPEREEKDDRAGVWPFGSSSGSAVEVRRRLKSVEKNDGGQLFLSSCMLINELFPTSIFKLTNLVILDISFNNLDTLLEGIGEMTSLRELWANDNPLATVPANLCNLKELRVLDLRNSWLRNIPREYSRLMELKLVDINLENCPLKPTLSRAYADGCEGLFKYLKRKDDRRKYVFFVTNYCLQLTKWIMCVFVVFVS